MPVTLYKVSEGIPDGVSLALVIAGYPVTEVPGQRHAGFVIKGVSGSLFLAHLATHNKFLIHEMESGYAYLPVDFIDEYSAAAITSHLYLLLNSNAGKIRYGIEFEDGGYFDSKSGGLLKNEPGQGLTCASFVLEVLLQHGYELVDKASWPLTEENAQWQASILKRLSDAYPNSAHDFYAQLDRIGKVPRFKPEEAIGAANYFEYLPLPFSTVAPAAVETISELLRLNLDSQAVGVA